MSSDNHHWVPKHLLKNFADDDGRVYCLDIHTDEVTKPPPKHAASEPGFNDFEINGKTVSFESSFGKIETKAAPVLKRIIAARSLAVMSPIDRAHVACFVAMQSFRTKAFYEGLTDKPPRQSFGSVFKLMWISSLVTARMIARRHWALMVIEDDEVFYLSDNPVVLQRTRDMGNGSNLGFDVPGVEAFLPLSPKCALYMACPTVSREIIACYESAMTTHRAMRLSVHSGYGGLSPKLREAQSYICRSRNIYQSFTTGASLVAEPANVENLNYLQCSWGLDKVFSNRRDFTFARRVFQKTPQYRTAVRTSLLEKGHIFFPAERESPA